MADRVRDLRPTPRAATGSRVSPRLGSLPRGAPWPADARASWATAALPGSHSASLGRSRPARRRGGNESHPSDPGSKTHPSLPGRGRVTVRPGPCSPLRSLLPSPALLRARCWSSPSRGRRAPGVASAATSRAGESERSARNAHAAQIPSTPSAGLRRRACKRAAERWNGARTAGWGGTWRRRRELHSGWGKGTGRIQRGRRRGQRQERSQVGRRWRRW